MKKLLTTLLFSTLLLSSFSMVRAEDGNRSTVKDRISELKESFKNERDSRISERQGKRDERAEKHASRLSERFTNYYERLTTIIDKVQTRLTNMAADGKDVTASQSKLNDARTKLESAKTLSAEAINLFNSITADNYEAQKTIALSARDKANEARKAFLEVHSLIKEAVRLAKGIEK